MLIKLLIPVIIGLLLVSCSPKKADKLGFSIKNNIVYRNDTNTPYTGLVKSISDGKIFEYYVVNGIKNGEFKASFEKGNLIMKGNIVNDFNEGAWFYYYPSGELETEGNFKTNKPDSVWNWYFRSGKLKEKGVFVNGLREGNWRMFDELGKVAMDSTYKRGVSYSLAQ